MIIKSTGYVFKTAVLIFLMGLTLSANAHNKVVVIPMGSDSAPLKNVISVALKNGDFSDPLQAMASITDSSSGNPYLVFVAPGFYDIDTEQLVIPPFVHMVGSGVGITEIVSFVDAVGTTNANLHAAAGVVLQEGAAVSNITLNAGIVSGENTSIVGFYFANSAVSNVPNMIDNVSLVLKTTFSSIEKNFGIVGTDGGSLIVRDSTIVITDGAEANGILVRNNAVIDVRGSTIQAEAATSNTAAEDSSTGTGHLIIRNSVLTATGTNSTGVKINNTATRITQVEINGDTNAFIDNMGAVNNCLDVYSSALTFLNTSC